MKTIENEEKEKTETGSSEDFKVDGTIFNLGYLVNVISDYYTAREPNEELEEADQWKKGTKYEPSPSESVPKDVDDLVRETFKTQLKKFTK